MEHFLEGTLTLVSSWTSIGIFFAGLFGGLVFGAIPGVSMLTLGPIFLRKSRTTEGYLLGDRQFPGWLLGFSMFATSISSMSSGFSSG